MKNKYCRILISPFVIIYTYSELLVYSIFAVPLVFYVMISFFGLISYPFINFLNKSGRNIEYIDPIEIIDIKSNSLIVKYLIDMTLHVWMPFYILYIYIKTGKIESII